MATEAPISVEAEHSLAHPESAETQNKPVKRSWRRKYRKMRIKFDDIMTQSNQLIRDEYKAAAISRRLQEQNDQLLECLLALNDTPHLPANLRFDLSSLADVDAPVTFPSAESQEQYLVDRESGYYPPIPDMDPAARRQKIKQIQSDLAADHMDAVHMSRPSHRLGVMEATVPHTTQIPDPAPDNLLLNDPNPPGYLDPDHEDEYLAALDNAIADPNIYDPDAHDGRPLRIPSARHMPTEKELSIQNPDSVYNWLRKHQPQVFLQDKDASGHALETAGSEKNSARPTKSKRGAAAAAAAKAEAEADDDGSSFVAETGGRSKRGAKGDDDQPYRPKGGSSRASKRKRDDGDSGPVKGRKKGRASTGAAAAS
ncbi:hypothetical protein M011DRAFT_450024 [Sporormia fimetaria CBS 119925]|uniref:IEC3 subunit of the Ino80 complex, chromatin re-modelling-domain-containing protein n=1 Tax=Sporormia fimetaria CBS 119925 TaxID=1340428 RepID=A0A6A6V488_9PLEO|nr:hypothetical protein M011DRAFT_450024 [Sporormia fimetaria CBS 119925]